MRGSFEEALSASSVARVKQTKPKKEVKEESNGGVDSDDDVPLSARVKEGSAKKRHGSDEEDDDYAPQVHELDCVAFFSDDELEVLLNCALLAF